MKSRKGLLIITGVLAALIAISIAAYLLLKNVNESQTDKQRTQEDTIREVDAYFESRQNRAEELAALVKQPSDLNAYNSDEQASTGLLIINQSIEAKDLDKAKAFASYLMERDDADGILASKLCYKVVTTESEKQACISRATEQATKQGIISEGEKLPEGYMELKYGDE